MCARTSCRKIIEAYVTKATVNRFVQSLSDEQTSRRHEDGKTLARSCRRRKAQRREDLTMGASASLHIENSVAQVLGNLIDTNVENMSNEDAVQEVRQLRHLLNNLAFHEKQDKLKAELSLPIDASDLSGEDLAANTAEVIRIRTLLNEYLFLETLRTYGSLHEASRTHTHRIQEIQEKERSLSHTHTHTHTLSLCLSVCLSVCLCLFFVCVCMCVCFHIVLSQHTQLLLFF